MGFGMKVLLSICDDYAYEDILTAFMFRLCMSTKGHPIHASDSDPAR